MDSTSRMGLLLGLAGVIAREDHADPVVAAALPVLLAFDDVAAALVVRETPEGPSVATALGQDLAPTDLAALVGPAEPGRSVDCPVPAGWAEQGVNRVTCRRLAGHVGVLVLGRGGASATDDDADALELALATLDTGLARVQSQADLHDLTARVNNAQQLANMGDYDWHIATDTNTWSNQLFRIYGHEPQSFNPSYEKFLSLIHPDDRERIPGCTSTRTPPASPTQMIERIVRPDGEVRYLSSNGEVIFGEDNVPIRMRGTCIDITDRVLADRERERSLGTFHGAGGLRTGRDPRPRR